MPPKQINLTWLRSFEAAARHLSFTDASAELGMTQAAVSLHIRSLEKQLKSSLFHRRARHLSLTELGQAYLTTVRQALSDIDLASASLFGSMTAHTITIKAPISTATLWLAPRLPLFKREFPKIELRLVTNIWTEATKSDGVDIEIRLGRGNWIDAQSEKISDETIVPVCAARLKGKVRQARDFQRGPLIHILGHEGHWERYFAANGESMPQDVPQYLVDTSVSAIQLAASEGGFATVMSRLVAPQRGRPSGVVAVGDPLPFPDAHYLMRRTSKHAARPEVELFETWLRQQFTDDT